jgi:hypothetical protein
MLHISLAACLLPPGSSIIDRIVHHAVIVKVAGASYRVKNLVDLQNLYNDHNPIPTKGRSKKNIDLTPDENQEGNFEND